MRPDQLTAVQLSAITVIERVCSTLSLAGCAFIILTFLGSKHFRKPINRLVFLASWGNIFTNVATIISRSALTNSSGALCQFQAFLIQMFMPADAYWTLAMACNVYLTFYHKYDADQIRRLERYYLATCYGVPFVPALVYIFAKKETSHRIYGNATLWCWIDSDWDYLRIATFYGPVWLVMLFTTVIYLRAGGKIYANRNLLRSFHSPPSEPRPINGNNFQSVKTTEVFVTSEQADITPANSIDLHNPGAPGPSFPRPPRFAKNAYTVTVSSPQQATNCPTPQSVTTEQTYPKKTLDCQTPKLGSMFSPAVPVAAYMSNPDRSNLYPTRRDAAAQADNAAWSYTKVALLFMVAMMVTWIPSSANRVFSVVHPGKISVGLEYASAFVLPLQGFWNASIYALTSFRACKAFWHDLTKRKGRKGDTFKQMTCIFSENRDTNRSNMMHTETESMRGFAGRPDNDESG